MSGLPKLLVLDDSATVREWIMRQVEESFQVVEATTSKEAVDVVDECEVIVADAILADRNDFAHLEWLSQTGKPMCIFSSLPNARIRDYYVPHYRKDAEGEHGMLEWLNQFKTMRRDDD